MISTGCVLLAAGRWWKLAYNQIHDDSRTKAQSAIAFKKGLRYIRVNPVNPWSNRKMVDCKDFSKPYNFISYNLIIFEFYSIYSSAEEKNPLRRAIFPHQKSHFLKNNDSFPMCQRNFSKGVTFRYPVICGHLVIWSFVKIENRLSKSTTII
jgi:hypothetical protein